MLTLSLHFKQYNLHVSRNGVTICKCPRLSLSLQPACKSSKINALLNGPFAHPDGVMANYMYVWEIPQANNPLIIDLPWPWYLAPLHVALLGHLIVVNALFRWLLPTEEDGRRLCWFE